MFTAPDDGEYLVRVSDTRGFQGSSFGYSLTVRPPVPDFKVTMPDKSLKVSAGSGREFRVMVDRIDGFDGPIRVDIASLPTGFTATTPVVIEPGHNSAVGVINAAADAPPPGGEATKQTTVVASAENRRQTGHAHRYRAE